MEREEYLRRCKMAGMHRSTGGRYTPNEGYDVWVQLDYHKEQRYRLTPIEYRLRYDKRGRVVHEATLIETRSNTLFRVALGDIYEEAGT